MTHPSLLSRSSRHVHTSTSQAPSHLHTTSSIIDRVHVHRSLRAPACRTPSSSTAPTRARRRRRRRAASTRTTRPAAPPSPSRRRAATAARGAPRRTASTRSASPTSTRPTPRRGSAARDDARACSGREGAEEGVPSFYPGMEYLRTPRRAFANVFVWVFEGVIRSNHSTGRPQWPSQMCTH